MAANAKEPPLGSRYHNDAVPCHAVLCGFIEAKSLESSDTNSDEIKFTIFLEDRLHKYNITQFLVRM